jgi:hypothetical protein
MSHSTIPRAGAPVAELSFDDVEDTAPSTPYPRARLRAFFRRVYATWCARARGGSGGNGRRFLGLPW